MQDAALQRQIRDTYDHISKTRRETFASRQDSMSRVSQGWTNTIAGTDTWSGGGESYSAPTGYGYGWARSDGTTYYTNDSTFNPNHSSNFSGWSSTAHAADGRALRLTIGGETMVLTRKTEKHWY
jgi:hypothetical protein